MTITIANNTIAPPRVVTDVNDINVRREVKVRMERLPGIWLGSPLGHEFIVADSGGDPEDVWPAVCVGVIESHPPSVYVGAFAVLRLDTGHPNDPDYIDPARLKARAARRGGPGVIAGRPRLRRPPL